MSIIVVGLGPGDGRFLTRQAWQTLTTAEAVYLRTRRHPAVVDLPDGVTIHSFDHLYETAESFDEVYAEIVSQLLQLGREQEVVYAVPGHPFVGEATVTGLVVAAESEGMQVDVLPGISFVESVLSALKLDGLDGLQLFDAIELTNFHYPPVNPDVPLLLGQVYNRLLASEVKLLLTAVYPDEHPIQLVHMAGTDEQLVESMPLYEMDRSQNIGHLTSLFVFPLPYRASLATLAETVAVLRSPEGCPWDQEQTPQSMRSGFLEEASEVLAALDANDSDNLCEELGDVLYHLVMQTQMAAEMADFTLSDVIAGIEAKLKHRHPHVWGDWRVADSAEVVRNWEMIKQQEKGQTAASLLDGVPETLPALAHSQKLQQRVRKVGFDWPDIAGVYAKVDEEMAELKAADSIEHQREELGDLLFVLVNVAHWLGLDAEAALREANMKFDGRFRLVEHLAKTRQLKLADLEIDTLEELWQEAKRKLAKIETVA